jgi:DNA-nicking Smr family endonuclease
LLLHSASHMKEDEDIENAEAVELPIDGVLDLHTFHPGEVKDLLPEYLTACREKGILAVRIIHGKGTGMLRETVHALLKRLPEVVSFRLAGQDAGSWGATIVSLRPTVHAQKGRRS